MAAKKGRGSGLSMLQEELVNWLLLDPRTRQVHNLPAHETEWAEWKGVTTRTMRRWKALPEFDAYMEQERARRARRMVENATVSAEGVGGARPATDARSKRSIEEGGRAAPAGPDDDPLAGEDLDPQERKFLEVHDALAEMALGGNASAMDSYIKHFGKPFLQQMNARDEDKVDLSDEELVTDVVRMLGPDRVGEAIGRLHVDGA